MKALPLRTGVCFLGPRPALGKWKMRARERVREKQRASGSRRPHATSDLTQSAVLPLTFHEPSKGEGASGGDGQRELVDGHSVGDGEPIDAFVWRLPGQQLPQQHAVAGGRGGGRLEVKPG